MNSRLFPGIGEVQDENLRRILYDMAMKIEMVVGSATGLTSLPAKPTDGLMERFAAGIAGSAAGLYEYRNSAWVKL